MPVKWLPTKFRGVRYYKHQTRRHGAVKFDQYYAIRYQRDGERKEEGLGWASEGWSAEKAFSQLATLKEAAKKGESGSRLSERREKRRKAKDAEARDIITFGEFWENSYLPQAEADKGGETMTRERSLFSKWLSPLFGPLPFREISPLLLERLKSEMSKEDLSPRSIQYALALTRQVFNEARRRGVFSGANPVKRVKSPKVDNRRLRFLSREEADALLDKLLQTDREAWEMSLLSLHCGLRAGEIFKLVWADIDTGRGLIAVKDSKSGRSRFVHMTEAVKEMLLAKTVGEPSALLYRGPGGALMRSVPRTIKGAIDTLGFNAGRKDRRDRVVFHSLRHSFASWLVQSGVDLYTVRELMGHSTLQMTERYAHLAPENTRAAINTLEALLREPAAAKEGVK